MKKLTIILIALLVVFSATSASSTYAYWNNMSRIVETSRVTIGSWRIENTWLSNVLYHKNDIVLWKGVYYVALRTSQGKEPGKKGSQNFWKIY